MTEKLSDAQITRKVQNPHLKVLLENVQVIISATTALYENSSKAQLTWKPKPEVWNAVQCLDHLIVTGNLYHPRIRQAIEKARENRLLEKKPFRPSLFGKLFIQSVSPKSKLKLKTFNIFKPEVNASNPHNYQVFIQQEQELIELIKRADGLDLNKVKIMSPLSRLLKLSIGEAFWLLVMHQQRHLLQAKNLRKLPGFPN